MIKHFITLIAIITFASCRNELTKEELMQYINNPDNGLMKEKKANRIQYRLTYKPVPVILSEEFGNDSPVDDSLIKAKKSEYEKYYYFILSISSGGKDVIYGGSGSFQNFSQNIQKFSFGLRDHVLMTTDKSDTIQLADYFLPNFYGMAKSTQMLLAFEKPDEKASEVTVMINDLGLGTGTQRFIFRKEDLESVPAIKKDI